MTSRFELRLRKLEQRARLHVRLETADPLAVWTKLYDPQAKCLLADVQSIIEEWIAEHTDRESLACSGQTMLQAMDVHTLERIAVCLEGVEDREKALRGRVQA